jgi:hypothetical protein
MNDKRILNKEKSLFKYKYIKDINYLAEVIDDNYEEIGKSGNIFYKDDVINELSNLKTDRNITIFNYKCRKIDTNIYLINYITKHNQNNIFRTSIWKQENNKFKIIFHQASLYSEDIKLISY